MKILKNFFLLWIMIISLLSTTNADILPENSHKFNRCVQIENPSEVEWFKLIIWINTVNWYNSTYQIEADTCLQQHYKFWESTPYLIKNDINFEEFNSNINNQEELENNFWDEFTRFDAINPNGWYISNSSKKTYENITYKLTSDKNGYKLIMTEQDHDWIEDSDLPKTLIWYTTNLSNPNGEEPENPNEILENWYTREMNNAYEFAYDNWITTMPDISKANMNWNLNRIAMAKMLSQYAINILHKESNTTKICNFSDVPDNLDKSYDYWVTLACQLWIMWVNVKNFRPYDIVTRAEFATALSRLLYWMQDWSTNYYSTHLKALKDNWIINNTDPKLHEKRWYVMLMLMRSN